MKILCKLFGHKWVALTRSGVSPAFVRQMCRRCREERTIKITIEIFGGRLENERIEVIENSEVEK